MQGIAISQTSPKSAEMKELLQKLNDDLKKLATANEEITDLLNELAREHESLNRRNATLTQALLEADCIARKRGDVFGLSDCIDNDGQPYQSAWLGQLLQSVTHDHQINPTLQAKIIAKRFSTTESWGQQ